MTLEQKITEGRIPMLHKTFDKVSQQIYYQENLPGIYWESIKIIKPRPQEIFPPIKYLYFWKGAGSSPKSNFSTVLPLNPL